MKTRVLSFTLAALAAFHVPARAGAESAITSSAITAPWLGESLTLRFTVAGEGSRRVLVRALGPALNGWQGGRPRNDPTLMVFAAGSSRMLAGNQNWGQPASAAWSIAQATAALGATPLASGSADAALLLDLAPGDYIAMLIACGTGTVRLEASLAPVAPADPTDSIQKDLAAYQFAYDRSAVAAAVVRPEQPLATFGLGVPDEANAPDGAATDADTVFLVASISKTVTATAAMQLVESRRLSLDADIARYLPFAIDHPGATKRRPITLRRLLTHTAGLSDAHYYEVAPALYSFGADPAISLEDVLRKFLTSGGEYYSADTFASAPGTGYEYCNLGFALVGYLVERASGKAFDAYCEEKIFQPLGMSRTGWRLADVPDANFAMPLDAFGGAYGHYTIADYPNGGLFTTATDLGRFMRAYLCGGELDGKRILSAKTVAAMLTPQYPRIKEPGGSDQGLGWYRRDVGGRYLWGHAGSEAGVRTYLGFDPRTRTGAVLLMNKDFLTAEAEEAPPGEMLDKLIRWGELRPAK